VQVCSARYRPCLSSLLRQRDKPPLGAMVECVAVIREGRLLWLSPVEWALLLVSAALSGYLALLI